MSRKLPPAPVRARLRASTLASALALALGAGDALALGVGGLRAQSALNQPFVGEIDLLDVRPDELDTVKVRLATPEDFAKAGSERYHYLTQLRFTPQLSPRGNTVIRVSSREPIREPYMDFLVEVTWPSGRLVKGYTVLLDPPGTTSQRAAPIQAPVASPRAITPAPARPSAPAPSVAPAERPAASPPPPSATAAAGGFPKRIGPIRPGTGLWRLSRNNAPQGATIAQTAMALYRNNQGAFIQGDINRVKVGQVLTIPSAAELFALNPDQAERELQAAMRGEKVRAAPIADTSPEAPGGESRLKIAGAARDSEPAAATPDASETSDKIEEELLLVRETSETARQETQELRNRIRELEGQLNEIQQLLTLRSAELARIQGVGVGEAEGGEPATTLAGASDAVEEPVADEPAPLPADLEAALAAAGGLSGAGLDTRDQPEIEPEAEPRPEDTSESSEPSLAISEDPAEAPAPPGEDQLAASDGQPTLEETQVTVEADAGEGPADPEVAQTPPPGPEVAAGEPVESAPADEPLWRQLLMPVAGAAGVTALGLGAFGWLRARRRREESQEWEADEAVDLPARRPPAPRAGAAAVGPAAAIPALVSTRDEDQETRVESPGGEPVAVGKAEPGIDDADVISEADIYIAYGRYREAVDLLRGELDRSPQKVEVKLKLAEAYFGAKNFPALSELMDDLRSNSREEVTADQWRRLSEMAPGAQSEPSLEASRRLSPARTTSVPPATPGSTGVDPEHSVEEFFSLDISEAMGPSVDLSPPSIFQDSDSFAGEPEAPKSAAAFKAPSSPSQDDEAPLALDDEPFQRPTGLGAGSEGLGLDTPSMSDLGVDYSGGASDLEVTIDDLRTASDLDLDSFVDSTRTSTFADELDLARDDLGAPVSPGGSPGVATAATTENAERGETPGLDGPEVARGDLGSSDLLTSQWQMDSGLWDETATKLDLARAYIEMGDQDSARGILEEVVSEGSDEQRGEATELLRGLT